MKGPYFFSEEEEIRRKEGKKGRKRRVGMGKKEGERFVKKGRGRRMDGWVDGKWREGWRRRKLQRKQRDGGAEDGSGLKVGS